MNNLGFEIIQNEDNKELSDLIFVFEDKKLNFSCLTSYAIEEIEINLTNILIELYKHRKNIK